MGGGGGRESDYSVCPRPLLGKVDKIRHLKALKSLVVMVVVVVEKVIIVSVHVRYLVKLIR